MITRVRATDENDPDVGYFKRKALRLRRLGVVAVGPSAPPSDPPPPTREELVRAEERRSEVAREHRAVVEAEIAALDRHAAGVARRAESLEDISVRTFLLQELKPEARQLAELRRMLLDDLAAGPILRDRDGRAVDDRMRAIVRARARELAARYWSAGARADASGDRRRGRLLRRDALRSRLIAENEHGMRASLPGYGICAWN